MDERIGDPPPADPAGTADAGDPPRGAGGWHVAVYMPDLGFGGAERAGLNLAGALTAHVGRVTVLLDRRSGPLEDSLPADAAIVSLNAGRTLAAIPGLVRFLRRERPDFLISYLDFGNVIAVLAKMIARSGTKILTAHQNTLSRQVSRPGLHKDRLLPALYRLFLPRADRCVAACAGVAEDLKQVVGRDLAVTVIHNPIVTPRLLRLAHDGLAHPWFSDPAHPVVLGVGRLVPQKNFTLLIDAFALLPVALGARLVLLGGGPLRDDLLRYIAERGLSERAQILPPDPNPWRYMSRARVMALSSHYEGFANVLVEALASGNAVVSVDCPHGPSEVLGNGTWGQLVPQDDAPALAAAIARAVESPPERAGLRARAMEFSTDAIARRYLALFDVLLAR